MERVSKRRRIASKPSYTNGVSMAELPQSANTSPKTSLGARNAYETQVRGLLRRRRSKFESPDITLDNFVASLSSILKSCPDERALVSSDLDILAKDGAKIKVPGLQLDGAAFPALEVEFPSAVSVKALPSWFSLNSHEISGAQKFQIGVEVPSLTEFGQDDYLEHWVFKKHGVFLALLARLIYNHSSNLHLQYFDSGDVVPVAALALTSSSEAFLGDLSIPENIRIEIYVFASQNSLNFSPATAAALPAMRNDKYELGPPNETVLSLYRAAYTSVTQTLAALDAIDKFARVCPHFSDVHELLDVWLQKRGFRDHVANGGFGPFAGRLLHLVLFSNRLATSRKGIVDSADAPQVFKALLQALATKSFHDRSEGGGEDLAGERFDQQPFSTFGSFSFNIFGRTMPWSFQRLRSAARETLAGLRSPSFETFNNAFCSFQKNSILTFDSIFSLKGLNETSSVSAQIEKCKLLYHVLAKGLSSRVSSVDLQVPALEPWSIMVSSDGCSIDKGLKIMLRHNYEQARSTLLKGPPAQQPAEAHKFREFWGSKAELRRFKDGSILESVRWDSTENENMLLLEILKLILPRHVHGIQASDISLLHPSSLLTSLQIPEIERNSATRVDVIFEKLRHLLTRPNSLPLEVRHFASSSTLSQFPSPTPIEVVIQFEGSAQWPDDFHAIRNIKIAFLAKLAKLLRSEVDIDFVGMSLEAMNSDDRDQICLELCMLGQRFRLRIHHDRDVVLLSERARGNSSGQEKLDFASAIVSHQRRYVYGPLHAESIRLLTLKYPFLHDGLYLFKSWCSYQRVSDFIPVELMELVVCQALLSCDPEKRIGSAQLLFFQAIRTLADWKWMQEPLIVDFSLSMNKIDKTNIVLRFHEIRASDPRLQRCAMVVATNQEPTGTVLTLGRPSKQLAWRWHALAMKALDIILEADFKLDVRDLCLQSLADYHFILRLRPAKSDSDSVACFANLKTPEVVRKSTGTYSTISDFVQEVQLLYKDILVLFWSRHVPEEIPGIWLIGEDVCRLKGGLGWSARPVPDAADRERATFRINKAAILNEIARLGGKVIRKIEVVHSEASQ